MRRLPQVAARVEAEVEYTRLKAGLPIDPTLLGPLKDDRVEPLKATPAIMSAGEAQTDRAGLTLGEAYRRYLSDPTRSWSPSTRGAYETCWKVAVAVIGEDVPITSISRVHCRDLLDVLRFLPTNAAKRFPKLTLRRASERARLSGDHRIVSPANANSMMSSFATFLNWAVEEEMIGRNPARGLRLPDPVAKRDKRLPFSTGQLSIIFNAPLYRGCVDDERNYAKSGNRHPRNARFWVPLIGLFTGARLGEICQLDVADIRNIEGVQCIVLTERSLVGSDDKRLKTGASERLIPLHPTLIDCGFLRFVELKRGSREKKLFDDIEAGTRGVRSVAFSKWFGHFLRSCGARRPLTCYHSFRHVFRDELRVAKIEHDIAMLLGGWTGSSAGKGVSENYGSGHRVEALHEAICKLKFDCVDVSHLKAQ